ncbi:MAG TPA: YXWGXW repeat-containing protein [Gemmataceae bacterium]|jgi:hypothetical protein|nr:YXWGXW repeat-containing protein [Gemmataceae bacterium]
MKVLGGLITLAAALLLVYATIGQQDAQAVGGNLAAQEGVDVQTHGPIHEAYAQPAAPKTVAAPIVAKRPPEPVNELPPESKPEGNQAQWIPGYWAWDDDQNDFLWVSGIWRVPPPDRNWVPGYWQQVNGGQRWISGFWGVRADASLELLPAPPEPIAEALPPQPNADTIYVPGIWVNQESRYLWRPGHWVRCRPGWVWVPAHYYWTPGGYVFVRGFWDYELEHRGLLFAPVFLNPRIYVRPGWAYRPHFTIAADFLLGSLFVNIGTNAYFFGDYYAPAYAQRGFVPWIDYRIRGNVFDPLFSYYRWQHRGEPRWEADLRGVYVTRRDNMALRPARTLALQGRAGAKLVVATPLDQLKSKTFKLEPVTKVHAEEIRKNTVEWRDLSKQRGKIEMDVKPAVVNLKQPNVVQSVKVALPKTTIVHPEVKKVAPPHPELPKAVPHPVEKREKAEKKASLDRRGIMDWLCLEGPHVTCRPLGTIGRERSRVPVA